MTTRYDADAKNVLGEELQSCSLDPVTGFFRNGCCETGPGAAYETPNRDRLHGRLYRIVYDSAPAPSITRLDNATPAQLVKALTNDNMFWRMTAQRRSVIFMSGLEGVSMKKARQPATSTLLARYSANVQSDHSFDVLWLVEDDILVPVKACHDLFHELTAGSNPPHGVSGVYQNRHTEVVGKKMLGGWIDAGKRGLGFDQRIHQCQEVGIQLLDGVSGATLGVLTALIVADHSEFTRSFVQGMKTSDYFKIVGELPNEEAGRAAEARSVSSSGSSVSVPLLRIPPPPLPVVSVPSATASAAMVRTPVFEMVASEDSVAKIGAPAVTPTRIWPFVPAEVTWTAPEPLP